MSEWDWRLGWFAHIVAVLLSLVVLALLLWILRLSDKKIK